MMSSGTCWTSLFLCTWMIFKFSLIHMKNTSPCPDRSAASPGEHTIRPLDEWRHWLEGTKQPFLVWTDHMNLESIWTAKRFNSRQARWSLFFTRFNFHLSNQPGSRNLATGSDRIPPESCRIATLTWELEESIEAATLNQPGPSNCPARRLFVPPDLRSDTLLWTHASRLTCHAGIQRTLDVVRQRFWWATLEQDTREFVNACPTSTSPPIRPPPVSFDHCRAFSPLVTHISGLCHRTSAIQGQHGGPHSGRQVL